MLAAPAATHASEVIRFDSVVYPPTAFKVERAKLRGITLQAAPKDTIEGELHRPPGKGPYPAVLLMHGCGGQWRWNDVWAERLVTWGYVVFDIDSFGPRGIEDGCRNVKKAGPLRRALDAHGAYRYLAGLPFVLPDRIAVMGMSHGGGAALWAIDQRTNEKIKSRPFRAAVALYPICEPGSEPNAPTLILIGQLDRNTEPAPCKRYVSRLQPGHEVTLKIYPAVYHVFDIEGVDWELFGGILRYDETAAKDALKRVRAFLQFHLQ